MKIDEEALKDWHWPQNRWPKVEYACPHGIGHGGMHGCDGCCHHPSYKEKTNGLDKKDN